MDASCGARWSACSSRSIARVVGPREGCAAEADERGDRLRLFGERALEERLRGLGTSLIEVRLAEPDERRHVTRLSLQRPLERRLGFRRLAAVLVEMREVLRPL